MMTSHVVHAQSQKERIISLKPNITEILIEMGLTDQLVGITTYCDYPENRKKISRIGDYVHLNVEKIISLRPTLVIGSEENSLKKEIDFLKKRNIRVFVYPFTTLDETKNSILRIAELLGKDEEGKKMVKWVNEELERLATLPLPRGERVGERVTSRVLMVVGTRPLVAVGGNNLLDDLLALFGFENVARGSHLKYPVYSLEKMIAAKPDIIVDLSMGSEEHKPEELKRMYRQYQSIPAVKNDRIYFFNMTDFRASPRIVVGAKKLAEALYVIPTSNVVIPASRKVLKPGSSIGDREQGVGR